MDETEDLDLEDIEARLYSQVYHGSAESEETADNTIFDESSTNCKKKYRYFDQKLNKSDPVLTQVVTLNEQQRENTDNVKEISYNFVQENTYNINNPLSMETISSPSNTATISTTGSQDLTYNITVNQYSLPLINPNDLSPADQNNINSLLTFLPTALDNPKVGQRKKRSRKKKNTNIKRVLKDLTKSTRTLRSTVTVYVSDSDSDDCVVLDNMNNSQQEINTKFPRKYNESEGGTLPEPDDDIIFVPPPPVEIINVEIDENEKSDLKECVLEKKSLDGPNYNPEEGTELIETPESTFSNDFLDNSNLDTNNANFNFSLHGSEFRSGPSEVIKSRKPTEYCETESSCSTNDQQSRVFSNTVKTIVFDEVEFPREDIFSDKNLESFSSFITPKRSCPDKPNSLVSKSTVPLIENDEDYISSGTSSSESDYESNVNSKSNNLPSLSPMVPNDNLKNAPKKSAQNFLKPFTKKAAIEEKEASNIMKKPGLPKNSKEKKDLENLRKKRYLNNDEMPNENLDEENTDVIYDQLGENCQSSTPNLKSKKKKKRVNSLLISHESENIPEVDHISTTQESTANDSSIICISDTSVLDKTKKKKKNRDVTSEKDPTAEAEVPTETGLNEDDSLQLLHSDDVEDGCNSEKSKKKKKKRGENSEIIINNQESAIASFVKDVEITMDLSHNLEPKKKKKKKLKDGIDYENKKGKERKNRRKRKKIEFEENTSHVIDGTSESQEAYDTPQSNSDSDNVQINAKKSPSNSVILIENETNSPNDCIVVDSDDSSDVELVLSTDTELDFEVLDDIDDDLSLNCSTSKHHMEQVNVSNEEVDRVIKHARVSLEDGDQFDVETIQNQQSNDPDKWKISYRDRGLLFNSKSNRGPRCNRCRHFGHIGIRCPEKPHPQPCTLCGRPDHQEPRCPNQRCLQCGNPGVYSTTYCIQCFKFRNSLCMLCRMPGHIQKFCPDLWRRYHLTNDGPIVASTARPISRNEQWCSGCAKRGHLEHECDYYNRQFPPTTPFIMNYNDVLNLRKTPEKSNVFQPMANSPPIANQQIVNPPTVNMAPMGNAAVSNPPLVNPPLVNLPMVTPQMVNTVLNFVPPQGSNVPNLQTELGRKVIPHSSTHNMTIQVSNTPTPNDIVLQMMLNFNNPINNSNDQPNIHSNEVFQNNQTNNITQNQFNNQPNQFRQPASQRHNIDLNDEEQIKNYIMNMPNKDIYDFIRDEMDYMKNSNIDPRVLKRKLIKYDRIDLSQKTLPPNLVRERNFWWKILNMVILGVNKHKDGRLHLIHLNRYLDRGKKLKLDFHKRRSLLSSYLYIFGNQKRPNVDYYKIIRTITRQYSCNSN